MESIRNSQTNYAMRLLVVLTSIIVCVAQSNFSRPGEFNPIGSLPPLPQQQQNQNNQNQQQQQQQQPQQQIDHSHGNNDGSHQIPSNVIDMPIQITIQGFQGNHVHSHPPMQIVYPVKVALPFQPMQLSFEAHVDIPNEGRESDMTRVDLGPQQMTLFDTSNSAFGTNSIANNNNNNNNNNNGNQNQFGNFNNGNSQNNNFNQNTNGIFRGDENGQFNNNQNNQNNNGGNFNGNQNGNFNNNNNNNNNNGIGNNFNGNQNNNNNNFNGNFPGNRNDNLNANNQNNNVNNFNGNGNFPQPPTTIQPPPPAGVGVPGIQNIPPFGQNQNQIG